MIEGSQLIYLIIWQFTERSLDELIYFLCFTLNLIIDLLLLGLDDCHIIFNRKFNSRLHLFKAANYASSTSLKLLLDGLVQILNGVQ